ncbi:MAG: FolB domain-containing protein [Ulvibacter sp.]|jgi:FolB domain-containing protein
MIDDFTKLEIKDLKINAIIGIHEQEKISKQPLIIDLTIYFDSKSAIETDNINDVVDYYDMSADLINFVSNSKFELIETLSSKILERVLSNKKIKKAILSIAKPKALEDFGAMVKITNESYNNNHHTKTYTNHRHDCRLVLTKTAGCSEQYLKNIERKDALPSKDELKNLVKFDESLPQNSSDPIETIEFLHKFGSPATTPVNGSRYFGFVGGAVTPAALGTHILTSAWNQNTVNESSSPIGAKIEEIVLNWIIDLFGLPNKYISSFVSGTAAGHIAALSAARNKIYQNHNFNIKKKGLISAPKVRIIISDEADITLFKAISIIGFGTDNLEIIPTDSEGRMIPDQIPELNSYSIVCTQAGNVSSGNFDPFEEIGKMVKKAKALMCVDSSFGLWAASCNNKKHLTKGLEYADFLVTDGHKTFNSGYDSAILLVKSEHLSALKSVTSCNADYLTQTTKTQSKDITLDFSKRTGAIDFWSVMRSLGKDGISDMVEKLCDNAQYFSDGLKKIGYEILNEVAFNQIVAKIGNNKQLDRIAKDVQNFGICWFGKTNWNGKSALRISISSFKTEKTDIDRCLHIIKQVTLKVVDPK